MSTVAQFLREGGTVADLVAQYAIKATWSKRYPHLVSLKYDQIDSPMTVPLVQECRGIILDSADHWRVVARPFDKFFNYGEGLAAPIDWVNAAVQEKVDGSLCIVYWYAGAWQVGTSGTPDASGSVGPGAALTFADLFWQAAQHVGLDLSLADRDYTLLFELTSPHNRIVIPHTAPGITLLGMRERYSGEEWKMPWEQTTLYGVPTIRTFPLHTLADVLTSFDTIAPLQQEGYVVVSYSWVGVPAHVTQFPRVKVKHPGYVALHQMKDRFSYRNALDVIRRGESGELLAAFPDLYQDFQTWQGLYDRLVARIEHDYTLIADCLTQKEFAVHATQTPYSAALFALRGGKASSVRAFLAMATLDAVCRWVEAL
jgi:RNA ligase